MPRSIFNNFCAQGNISFDVQLPCTRKQLYPKGLQIVSDASIKQQKFKVLEVIYICIVIRYSKIIVICAFNSSSLLLKEILELKASSLFYCLCSSNPVGLKLQMLCMYCFSFNAKIIINIVKINGHNWTTLTLFVNSIFSITKLH